MIERSFVAASTMLAFLGCGGRVAGESHPTLEDASVSADSAAAPADAGVTPTADAGDPRNPLRCPSVPPIPYDNGCASGADCVTAFVYVGCCATDALGVNARDLARFVDAAAECARLDPCDCAGNRTVADDGHTSRDPMNRDVIVECIRGACTTRIR